MRLVFLGPPGAGKGTLAQVLCKQHGIVHMSTGDMLREALKNKTAHGLKAKEYMEKGLLVPDELVIALVRERLSRPDAHKGFLLDGFPRTPEQAESLDKTLNELKMPADLILYFKTSTEVIIRRLSGRRVCGQCGRNYHTTNYKPKVEGICDDDGSKLIQRPDDSEATVLNRLKVYEEQTAPLIGYYRSKKSLYEFSGDHDVDELSVELEALFKTKGLH